MPNELSFNNKEELRRMLSTVRRELADKPELSRLACQRAEKLLHGNVMVYMPIGSELDTVPLIEKIIADGCMVFVPQTSADGTITPVKLIKLGKPDRLGNLPEDCIEKTESKIKLDFCVTPLLGFNDEGYRIGYGKGCYDRFFGTEDVYKIGIAFGCQCVRFKNDPFDVPLDCCVTDEKVIYFDHASNCGKIQRQ